jgi:hypothetical protein
MLGKAVVGRWAAPSGKCWRLFGSAASRRARLLRDAHTPVTAHTCRRQTRIACLPRIPLLSRPACYRHGQSQHHRAPLAAAQAHERAQCRHLQYARRPECWKVANDYVVVPSEDSHQSEYIAPCDARRGQSPRTCRRAAYIDPLQHTSAASLAPPATQSSRTRRPRSQPTGATSTRPRSSWTATGSC